MADFNLSHLALLGALGAAAPPYAAVAAPQAISVDAQSSDIDLRTNNVVFHKVRIAQGATSVSAELGSATKQATKLNFENSLWVFRGNVNIVMGESQLSSDDAEINFADNVIAKAVINGKPAAFEQRLTKTGKTAYGRAESIDYDAHKGVVRLAKNAWLSDGQTEIHGESLKYNVLAQSIVADSADQGSQRVHIVIAPPPAKP